MTIAFEVDDMHCGHCVGAITQAVRAVDGQAGIDIDLAAHRVAIAPVTSSAEQLRRAISDAGYTPRALGAA